MLSRTRIKARVVIKKTQPYLPICKDVVGIVTIKEEGVYVEKPDVFIPHSNIICILPVGEKKHERTHI